MTIPVSSPWQTLLASPGPDGHVVQLYQDDGFFGDAVSHFAASGLAQGDAVILVATGAHWELLADCLSGKGLDVVALRRHGQLLLLDADATLPTFLVDTLPDAPTFKALARATIAQARTGSQSGRVRWWGEMVNVLFVNGNGRGSTRLEELFDEVAHEEAIAIFCSFLMDPFDAKMYEGPLQAVCGTHAHLIPVANEAHQTACVHQALLDVFGTVEGLLLDALRSAKAWQGTGMPPAQALLLWLHGTVPHVAARVLARARYYAQIAPGGRPLWSRIRP
jgi:MEDS: MEthanogen/methylotroph, DcmR Sensory domain